MNVFVAWKSPLDGVTELVTPPLDGTILPGVTRDSVLALARSWGPVSLLVDLRCSSHSLYA
jgi:branched-chain amino acid aminotransferase